MIVQNTKYYRDLPFEDYLKLPGTSFSSLKEAFVPSEGMKLGTRVHNYLLEPAKYDWQQVDIVKAIASAIRQYIGEAFKFLEKEISFTAEFISNNMVLQYRGRADMLVIGKLLIDLKVLAGSLEAAVKRFGYADQVSGYCLATGAQMGLIIAYNKAAKKVEIKWIKPSTVFWEYTTVTNGEPITKY